MRQSHVKKSNRKMLIEESFVIIYPKTPWLNLHEFDFLQGLRLQHGSLFLFRRNMNKIKIL